MHCKKKRGVTSPLFWLIVDAYDVLNGLLVLFFSVVVNGFVVFAVKF